MKSKIKHKILASTIMLLVGAFLVPTGVLAQSQGNGNTGTTTPSAPSSNTEQWLPTTSDTEQWWQTTSNSGTSSSTVSESTSSGATSAEPVQPGQENPFTPDGQATVVDQATESDGKDFLTIKTPDGSEFFLVVDHQRNTDNVYFLNAVTEQDLIPLTKKEEQETLIPEVKPPESIESMPEETTEPEQTNGGIHRIALFLLMGIIVAGAAYYVKTIRSKKELEPEDDDDFDPDAFDDEELEYETDEDSEGYVDEDDGDEEQLEELDEYDPDVIVRTYGQGIPEIDADDADHPDPDDDFDADDIEDVENLENQADDDLEEYSDDDEMVAEGDPKD